MYGTPSFKGPYLRVTTPVTTNGTTPLLINGVQQTEETFLPLTAKKELDKKNKHLERTGSSHLVMKIEIVGQ
jgi:hypothetical protein